MERALAVVVPLRADLVGPYRLTSGSLGLAGGSQARPDVVDDILFFEIENGGNRAALGRVTFEGLDAIRASRGEISPYDQDDFTSWVYEVQSSRWLQERHDYEVRNYETPLLETHRHYLFRFHDNFVEAIAAGIWLDQPSAAGLFALGAPHPLAPLDAGAPRHRGMSSGLAWELRLSVKPADELLRDSVLCSQRLFELHLELDGSTSEPAVCWVRTSQGRTTSHLARPWFGRFADVDGVATPDDMMPAWERYCSEVAERRRSMGK